MEGFPGKKIAKTALLTGIALAHSAASSEQQKVRTTSAHHPEKKISRPAKNTSPIVTPHDETPKGIQINYKKDSAPKEKVLEADTLHMNNTSDAVPEKSPEAVLSAPITPIATEPKKIETPKNETVVMGLDEFTNAIKDMITTSMREKKDSSKIKEMHIKKEGDHLAFDAAITSSVYGLSISIDVAGEIAQAPNGDSLYVSKHEVTDAPWGMYGKAEKKISKLLKEVFDKFQIRKGIEGMRIMPNGVAISYKK